MAFIHLNKQGWCIILISTTVLLLYYLSGRRNVGHMHGTTINLRDLTKKAIHLVEDAGYLIRAQYQEGKMNSRIKAPSGSGPKNEMLTDVDLLSHRLLVSGFVDAYPDLKVISEEHPPVSSDQPLPKQPHRYSNSDASLPDIKFFVPTSDVTVWVDPLDATQEFSEGLLDYVTVMICVALHGYPVIGVVHQPFLNRTYWSWSTYAMSEDLRRAMQNGTTALGRERTSMEQKNGKPESTTPRPLVVTHSRSHLDASQLSQVFGKQPVQLVPAGGSGFKVLSLIEGKAHLYVHPSSTRRWDVCAAQAILEATGGRLTGLDGTRLTYYATDTEKIPKTVGLFAATSIAEHKRWWPKFAELLKKN